jgi:hypothetical protein
LPESPCHNGRVGCAGSSQPIMWRSTFGPDLGPQSRPFMAPRAHRCPHNLCAKQKQHADTSELGHSDVHKLRILPSKHCAAARKAPPAAFGHIPMSYHSRPHDGSHTPHTPTCTYVGARQTRPRGSARKHICPAGRLRQPAAAGDRPRSRAGRLKRRPCRDACRRIVPPVATPGHAARPLEVAAAVADVLT